MLEMIVSVELIKVIETKQMGLYNIVHNYQSISANATLYSAHSSHKCNFLTGI